MDIKTLESFSEHAKAIFLAALGAALVQFIITFLLFLGNHIPDLIQFISQTAGGVAVLKTRIKIT